MQDWNKKIFYFINDRRSRFFGMLSWIFSNNLFLFLFLGFWITVLLIISHDFLLLKQIIFNLFLGVSIMYILSDKIIKKLFYFKRPYLVLENIEILGKKEINSSAPSNHTGLVATTILILCIYNPWFLFLLIIIPIVMWSRIYNGMHWPIDVILGLLLGLIVSNLTYILAMSVIK